MCAYIMYRVLWHRNGLLIWVWPGLVFWESAREKCVNVVCTGGGRQGGSGFRHIAANPIIMESKRKKENKGRTII